MAAVATRTSVEFPEVVAIALDTDYKPPLAGIRVGATGDVAVVNHAGDTVVFKSCAVGEILRGTFQQVKTTGTTVASPTANLNGYR